MKFLRKLREFFSGSNVKEAFSSEVAPGSAQQILSLPEAYIHPKDFMEELSIAIVMDTGKPLHLSSPEIKLYQLNDVRDGNFLGSFYGVMREGKYYGYHLGSKHIISCSPQAFVFKETEQLTVPLAQMKDSVYVLICQYTCDNGRLIPQQKLVVYDLSQATVISQSSGYNPDLTLRNE